MPTPTALLEDAASWKTKGNTSFQQGQYDDAITAYSQGVVLCDRVLSEKQAEQQAAAAASLKVTLLSNRAMCSIKSSGGGGETAYQSAIDDCTTALDLNPSDAKVRAKLLFRRAKARFQLYGSSSMSTGTTSTTTHDQDKKKQLLNEAAKDVMQLLQLEPHNKDGQQLLKLIRVVTAEAKSTSSSSSSSHPVQQCLAAIRSSASTSSSSWSSDTSATILQQVKLLLGLLDNDLVTTARELGRVDDGITLLLQLTKQQQPQGETVDDADTEAAELAVSERNKIAVLAMQCLSQAANYPTFVQHHLYKYQRDILATIEAETKNETGTINTNLIVSALAALVRIMLHADRDPIENASDKQAVIVKGSTTAPAPPPITATTKIDYDVIVEACRAVLQTAVATSNQQQHQGDATALYDSRSIVRACLDVITAFTANSKDRDGMIRSALMSAISADHHHGGLRDPTLAPHVSQADIRQMTAPQLAQHKKREYDIQQRDEQWCIARCTLLHTHAILDLLLSVAATSDNHVLRREIVVVINKMGMQLFNYAVDEDLRVDSAKSQAAKKSEGEEEKKKTATTVAGDKVRKLIQHYLGVDATTTTTTTASSDGANASRGGVVIEEITDDDEEEGKTDEEPTKHDLVSVIKHGLMGCALLLSNDKDMGTWLLSSKGWTNNTAEIEQLIASGNTTAMCLAAEIISAAVAYENGRIIVTNMVTNGTMLKLASSTDRDVKSAAASAMAKLGLSDKHTAEGDVISLLQAACELLEDEGDGDDGKEEKKRSSSTTTPDKSLRHFSSFATSSVERAIEMITYLVSKTDVKEELAAGFAAHPDSKKTALERLVAVADVPNAGESLSGFGLATIFQHMAVTNHQLRKEGFEGKEVTMEQYDEMQKMQKTEEEKDLIDQQNAADADSTEACNARIRKMAAANVPRALVTLLANGEASEHTLEQITLAMNRMANEVAARGIMIQQGVLSACIKLEKSDAGSDAATENDTVKKGIRYSRHCIAKLLITTNPSLLTSAQRLGCIKPLIQLIRDNSASDLQTFEALLAVTNIASSGEDAQNRIVSERGIPSLHYAMFGDHEMVRRASTEAMCNLVPHQAMMKHLSEHDNIKLWLSFASDYEDPNYECARAAAGCLAMATQDPAIAEKLVGLEKFQSHMTSLLECGRPELMHRTLAIVLNLAQHGGTCREKVISDGLAAFCRAYADTYHDNKDIAKDFPPEEAALLPVTVDLAQKVVSITEADELDLDDDQ